jgi:hypothetical protein
MTRIWCITFAGLLVASAGCSGRSSAPSMPEQAPSEPARAYVVPGADRPPASLVRTEQSAEELFDAAWSSDWLRAAEELQSLREAASDLPDEMPRLDLVAKLRSNIVDLSDATSMKQRVETMDAANAITQIVAELCAQFRPMVPYDVKMLGYYGRQIELGLASGRLADSQQGVSDLVTVWNRTEAAIGRSGHADDARRFSDLVVELMSATRQDDFVRPVTAELEAVSRLERIFTSQQ